GEHMAMTIIVLQTFAHQGGATRRCTKQEASCPCIRRSPDKVPYSLKTEHGVEDKERNRGHTVIAVGRACCNPGGDCPRLIQAFLQDLPVLGFFVIAQLASILWRVQLPQVRVNTNLA